MRILAIIPARGGSKRIERKNIKDFAGRPIISYSITEALAAGCFAEVMVSTDDREIAECAVSYGAAVPFMRSAETANDYATTADVIREVLETYRQHGKEFEAICCIYATAPFVTARKLRAGAEIIDKGEAEGAFTCVEYSYPTQRCLIINDKGRVAMKFPEYATARSQDLQKTYHDAGQFYFCTVKAFEKYGSLWGPDTRPIVLPELEVQDLDTPVDWKLAEMKFRLMSMPGRFSTENYEFIPYPEMTEVMSDKILKGRNTPEVRSQMASTEEISSADHKSFVKSLEGRRDKQYYAAVDKSGTLIGSVNMARTGGETMERGIWLYASERGKGHAKRMLNEMYEYFHLNCGTDTIETYVRNGNMPSIMLERSLGAEDTKRDQEYIYFKKSLR